MGWKLKPQRCRVFDVTPQEPMLLVLCDFCNDVCSLSFISINSGLTPFSRVQSKIGAMTQPQCEEFGEPWGGQDAYIRLPDPNGKYWKCCPRYQISFHKHLSRRSGYCMCMRVSWTALSNIVVACSMNVLLCSRCYICSVIIVVVIIIIFSLISFPQDVINTSNEVDDDSVINDVTASWYCAHDVLNNTHLKS